MHRTYPFTVDGHLRIISDSKILHLLNIAHLLHIRGVAACPKDDGYLSAGVNVVRCDKGSGGVVDESG